MFYFTLGLFLGLLTRIIVDEFRVSRSISKYATALRIQCPICGADSGVECYYDFTDARMKPHALHIERFRTAKGEK
jgi:hypothetical protein